MWIVTEDRDLFEFGGETIYRNMFDDRKLVEVYRAEEAMQKMSLGREQMATMAMLLGGAEDYYFYHTIYNLHASIVSASIGKRLAHGPVGNSSANVIPSLNVSIGTYIRLE